MGVRDHFPCEYFQNNGVTNLEKECSDHYGPELQNSN